MKNEVRIAYIYKVDSLANKVMNTIVDVKTTTEEKDYQIKGKLEISYQSLTEGLIKMSKNGLKKINKSILRLEKKMSIKNINLFLHYVMKNILKSEDRIRISVSIKEETIQNKRKEWLVAKQKADELLLTYKEEKGDFYK